MVNHPRFDALWEESPYLVKQTVLDAIKEADKDKVLDWIHNHPSLELEDRPVTLLRQIAYRLNIKNYSRLTKPELIRSIKKNGT